MKTVLYRLFDYRGKLLYVGVSGRVMFRCMSHTATHTRWGQVVLIKLTHFKDRRTALCAEREAIRKEKPKHNVMHSALLHADNFQKLKALKIGGKPMRVKTELERLGCRNNSVTLGIRIRTYADTVNGGFLIYRISGQR